MSGQFGSLIELVLFAQQIACQEHFLQLMSFIFNSTLFV